MLGIRAGIFPSALCKLLRTAILSSILHIITHYAYSISSIGFIPNNDSDEDVISEGEESDTIKSKDDIQK